MTEAPTQSPNYALIIGEKENSILTILMVLAFRDTNLLAAGLRQRDVSEEELSAFITDMSDKEHALGWCQDSKCKYEKPV